MIISRKLIYLCATVLTAVLSVGCSQSEGKDDPDAPGFEEGIPTEVSITLSSRSGNQTRADGKPKDPVASVEFIHDWWIAFVDSKKNVTILERKDAKNKVNSITGSSTDANANGGFEVETFKTIIPSGNYRIYAFANIPVKSADQIKEWLVKDPEDNKYKFQSKYISHFVTDPSSNPELDPKIDTKFGRGIMTWSSSENIPMTGQIDRQIKNTVEEAFSIEVVRAVAKVDFTFSNPTTDEIVLNKLELDSITSSEQISIVPNYKAVGIGPNNQLANKTRSSLKFDLDKTLAASGGTHALEFYCKETLPYYGGFDIKLKVTRAGENKDYKYRTTDITYINRNDWIHIPIKFNDWIIYWKLHYYPPIGGYPPVFKQNVDGSSMSATLTTGGEFELYPYKIKKNSEEADYYNDVDWDNVKISQLTDAEKNLFVADKLPIVMDNPNYNVTGHPLKDLPRIIAGELKPNVEGKVELKFTFYLKNTDSNNKEIPYADTKFECTFTITRQNSSPAGS